MSERFFVEQPVQGGHAYIVGSEAQHVVKVMRARVGDEVVVFDGSGAEFLTKIASISRQAVQLDVVERREIDRELARTVTVAVALPKGDRQQWLVEKLTELGVTRLVPVISHHSVAQPVDSALVRMQRWVIEASKQCGRNRLLEIAAPQPWLSYAAQASSGLRLIAHPGEYPAGSLLRSQAPEIIVAIGPEGGWTDEEVAVALTHGWQAVSLGPRILRVETAAVALATLAAITQDE